MTGTAEPTVTIHGAARTVTGSCYEVLLGGSRILIDCGLFQGPRTLEALNREPFSFDPRRIDAVLLTHAHLDHSGLLPRLVAEGFRGAIICTAATRDLLSVMLPDAAHIEAHEVERRNRRADRADEPPIEPLFTLADAERAIELVRSTMIGEWVELDKGMAARLWNAGHILGSASIELCAGGVTMLFSGDLGPDNKSFHQEPSGPSGVDHLFCESTYGDRVRTRVTAAERRDALAEEARRALAGGGNLVVPVFALERTQELLLDLATLLDEGRLGGAQIFIDSPLATRATRVFQQHIGTLEDVQGHNLFERPGFHFVESTAVSMRLNSTSGAIILAASGMCEGGRIRHHLRYNLPDRNSTILFVGFQAAGTLGQTIRDGAKRVRISGQDVAVRARIATIDSYSAHADKDELLAWIKARAPIRGSLFLTHGEQSAVEALGHALAGQRSVILPEIGERYDLPRGAPARRIATGRTDLQGVIRRDWQNDYADFAANLKRELQKVQSERERTAAIARMRAVLQEFGKHQQARRRTGSAVLVNSLER